jgi:di- and tripeptidase
MWLATKEGLTGKHTFSGCEGGVLSVVARNGTIYAGCQDGHIKIFDQDTKTLLRTLLVTVPASHQGHSKTGNTDVLSLSIIGGDLYACMGNGWCQRWCSSFVSTALWEAHERIGLSSIVTSALGHEYQGKAGKAMLLTGGADSSIKASSKH